MTRFTLAVIVFAPNTETGLLAGLVLAARRHATGIRQLLGRWYLSPTAGSVADLAERARR